MPHLLELESDSDIMRFTGLGRAITREESEKRLEKLLVQEAGPFGTWAAELRTTGEFVAWVMLKPTFFEAPEMGCMILKKFWGKGFATELGIGVLQYGLSLPGDVKIVATTDPANTPSIRVLEKIGMHYHKTLTHQAGDRELISHYYENCPKKE